MRAVFADLPERSRGSEPLFRFHVRNAGACSSDLWFYSGFFEGLL